ncbi:hypothetical protein PVAND_007273 [Polypedilum vanderplanki]|uniref:Uncharacterized protein n=1 Tax=Polypedilum vanderplanki TaxID=319348 RepID=A0A9J6C7B4_POLVA|nr:hypothetical protein PVAND_007273 [Polypedilum vanderplanki]
MVLFNKCCCFFRLTTGGMILGWIGAIESLLVVILTTIGLTHVPQIMDHLRNETRAATTIKMEAINETHVSIFRRHRSEMTAEDEMFLERGMYAILTLNLIVNVVTLISSLLLITGSIKRNSKYLLPWLVCEALCLIFSSFAAISKSFEMLIYNENFGEGFLTIFSILFLVGVEVYLYLCVYSLYQMLKTEEKNQRQMQLNEISNQASHKETNDGLPPYAALS